MRIFQGRGTIGAKMDGGKQHGLFLGACVDQGSNKGKSSGRDESSARGEPALQATHICLLLNL